jgi:hypothetical protein
VFIYGKVNEQRFNGYLKISGMLFIIYFSVNVITLNGHLFAILSIFSIISVSILNFMLGFFGLFGLIAWVLVIIHSIKNNDNDLLISGILAILAFGALYLYNGFILPLLY